MKVAIFSALMLTAVIANAMPHYDDSLPEFEYHRVTTEDCKMVADISKGAVAARAENAGMDSVLLGLMKPEHLQDDGYRAMVPMAIANVTKIFNSPAAAKAEVVGESDYADCVLYIGFDMPYQK